MVPWSPRSSSAAAPAWPTFKTSDFDCLHPIFNLEAFKLLIMVGHVPLCLECRKRGHDVEKCPADGWARELDWFFSRARRLIGLGTRWSSTDQAICSRCESLNLIWFFETLPPRKTQSEFTEKFDGQKDFIRKLGKTGSVRFWADCSVYMLLSIRYYSAT